MMVGVAGGVAGKRACVGMASSGASAVCAGTRGKRQAGWGGDGAGARGGGGGEVVRGEVGRGEVGGRLCPTCRRGLGEADSRVAGPGGGRRERIDLQRTGVEGAVAPVRNGPHPSVFGSPSPARQLRIGVATGSILEWFVMRANVPNWARGSRVSTAPSPQGSESSPSFQRGHIPNHERLLGLRSQQPTTRPAAGRAAVHPQCPPVGLP